jgi:hypothetical protein
VGSNVSRIVVEQVRNCSLFKYFTTNIIADLICLMAACLFLYRDRQAAWRSQIFFLMLTLFVEIFGKTLQIADKSNDWVYNFYVIAETCFVLYLFRSLISPYKKRDGLFLATVVLYFLFYGLDTQKHGIHVFHNTTTLLMSVIFIGYGFYYLYLLINDERDIYLARHGPFWWVAGTLCYYYGSSVNELYFTLLSAEHEQDFTYRHFIFIILNLILYGCWSYSFYCRYLQRKSTR